MESMNEAIGKALRNGYSDLETKEVINQTMPASGLAYVRDPTKLPVVLEPVNLARFRKLNEAVKGVLRNQGWNLKIWSSHDNPEKYDGFIDFLITRKAVCPFELHISYHSKSEDPFVAAYLPIITEINLIDSTKSACPRASKELDDLIENTVIASEGISSKEYLARLRKQEISAFSRSFNPELTSSPAFFETYLSARENQAVHYMKRNFACLGVLMRKGIVKSSSEYFENLKRLKLPTLAV